LRTAFRYHVALTFDGRWSGVSSPGLKAGVFTPNPDDVHKTGIGGRRTRDGKPVGGRPVTTPGYSGRPQAAKLGLKPGQRVGLHDPPDGWALTDPPAGLAGPGPDGQADVILAFFTEAGEIAVQIGELARRIYPAGALWVAWPRRAAGHRSDITDTVIREFALPLGLVDVKVAAIDEDWSGLRVVWRTEKRR
jgi:hypothetical protein